MAPAYPADPNPDGEELDPALVCTSARARRAASDSSLYGVVLGAESGGREGALEDVRVPGRGVAGTGLDGAAAACGRKLVVLPERPDVFEPPELLSVGRGVGVEPLPDVGAARPGAVGRLVPPLLAAARAAAASVGLEDGRDELLFLDAGLVVEDADGLENDELGRELLEGVVDTGRVPLEERGGGDGRSFPEPDDDSVEGADLGGAAENDDDDRPLEPDDAGVEKAEADFFTVGASEAPLSERSVLGRTRVVSSEASSLASVDEAFAEASVLIGAFPSPGFGRDGFSDRWLWSELTSHLHAQAVDEEPSSDSTLNHWH